MLNFIRIAVAVFWCGLMLGFGIHDIRVGDIGIAIFEFLALLVGIVYIIGVFVERKYR